MIEQDSPETTNTSDAPGVTSTEQITGALRSVPAKIVDLIVARSQHPSTAELASAPDETRSLQHAPRANLAAVARGEDASALVTSLSDAITAWEQASGNRKNIRRKGLENLKGAIAAFVADLLPQSP
jgi:hypothetical protein